MVWTCWALAIRNEGLPRCVLRARLALDRSLYSAEYSSYTALVACFGAVVLANYYPTRIDPLLHPYPTASGDSGSQPRQEPADRHSFTPQKAHVLRSWLGLSTACALPKRSSGRPVPQSRHRLKLYLRRTGYGRGKNIGFTRHKATVA